VARNTAILMLGQLVGAPLSMVVNGAMGRRLGPEEYGHFFLATTLAGFGFLLVEWGHGAVLGRMVSQDRSRSGVLLGSSLAWRMVTAPIAYLLMALGCLILGKGLAFQVALALVCLGQLLTHVGLTAIQVVRGFERADVPAYAQVGGQILNAALVLPALFLGGSLEAVLAASAAASALVAIPIWRALRPVGVGRPSVSVPITRQMFHEGTSFVILGLITSLQPVIDALMLSHFGSEEAVG
jgi:O-antigen/teichoic acid export membrane protein